MKQKPLQKLCSSILVLTIISSTFLVKAQVTYPYTADFEPASTTPSNKTYPSDTTVLMNGMEWKMPGVFLGTMGVGDRRNGLRAGRINLTNTSTGTAGNLYTISGFPLGIGTLSLKAAVFGTNSPDSLIISTSNDLGLSWNTVGSTPLLDTLLSTYTFIINAPTGSRLRIMKGSNVNKRVNIDDLSITANGFIPTLIVTEKTPHNTSVSYTTNSMQIKYNEAISVHAGLYNVRLFKNTDPLIAVQTFAVGTAAVTIIDSSAIMNGLLLENNTAYFIEVDSNSFVATLDTSRKNIGIYDSLTWFFETADTTSSPPIVALDSLNESFLMCSNDSLLGIFRQYNEVGSARWKCSNAGAFDNSAVYINGGTPIGSDINKDYLISKAPFDVGHFTSPLLLFWTKRRGSGSNTCKVQVSTDYVGVGAPSSATWTTLRTVVIPFPENEWRSNTGVDLSAYKPTDFYLAFVYESDSVGGAYEFSLDDVWITEVPVTGIGEIGKFQLEIYVRGNPTRNKINLEINTPKAGKLQLNVYDIQGKLVATENMNADAGQNLHTISNLNLVAGMYFIRIGNDNKRGSVKAVIR